MSHDQTNAKQANDALPTPLDFRIVHHELRPSQALRKKGSAWFAMPGGGFYGAQHREIYYHSDLERRGFLTCSLDPRVADIREQWPKTRYRHPVTGNWHDHIWDLCLFFEDRPPELVFVKPIPFVLLRGQWALFDQIRKYVPKHLASSAKIMTELDMDPTLVDLAQMVNLSLISPPPGFAEPVQRMIDRAPGPTTVRQIVHSFIPEGLHAKERPAILSDAYWSVVHAIARRRAFIASRGYFSMNTLVSRDDGTDLSALDRSAA